jgi:tetratricopeptide (TPR) repeat protein
MRSFDERSHSYLGYVLCLKGITGDEPGEFRIAIGKAAQAKHQFRVGMEVSGLAVPVPDPRLETAAYYKPQDAIGHYEVGLRIGELSLGNDFAGVLMWHFIDNRPFLRCMHGYGLCLWRLGRFDEATRVFERMLWLNPSDNQGVRFLIGDVKVKIAWEDHESE